MNEYPIVSADNLHVHLGNSHILRGVSLAVSRGEVVAVLGANGSGKSTLIRALTSIIPVTSGTIELFGQATGASAPWAKIGYVPQRITAQSGVTASASEVVASGLLHGRTIRLPRGAKAQAHAALESVHLADHAHLPLSALSGGQQQRVLIARALIRNPELLILDEPVAGVDHPSQEAFAATLKDLVDQGRTIIVVLHELGEFESLITRTVVLRHGRIIHDGPAPRASIRHAEPDHDHVHPHEGYVEQGSALLPELGFDQ
ncbi:metal ABC transporter ATP-binding protein [Jonesia quinghaiensis]|uniref:metal ABC transporter ATP-binding protein n=1 Tax=Jonesia quinghaiensis TaxID=262806 RepID=UPI00040F9ADE|nr:metal ABC transporter ATP-binding protein [Jonesia quinghaiensis]